VRAFVALNLPDATRRALWSATAPLREMDLPVKWVRPDGIHLTLKFLGETDEARQSELIAALARAATGTHALPLMVEGFGAFPDPAHARVLWAGVAAEPALELLQDAVERRFAPLGFPTEARTFRPHVTLGRSKREARTADFRGLEAALAALSFADTVVIESVDLMRSTLQSPGAVYEVVHRERLS
jgi:RNA 2',3'-cyclic 3'-phosphodiesterase